MNLSIVTQLSSAWSLGLASAFSPLTTADNPTTQKITPPIFGRRDLLFHK